MAKSSKTVKASNGATHSRSKRPVPVALRKRLEKHARSSATKSSRRKADTASKALPRTWGEIKRQIEANGVKDDDVVFNIEIGPTHTPILVSREPMTKFIKDRRVRPGMIADISMVEIADDPVLLVEIPESEPGDAVQEDEDEET